MGITFGLGCIRMSFLFLLVVKGFNSTAIVTTCAITTFLKMDYFVKLCIFYLIFSPEKEIGQNFPFSEI